MNKLLTRLLTVMSILVLLLAMPSYAKADMGNLIKYETASPYTKGITILDSIPTSIKFGDAAPQPRIMINGQTLVPGQDYTCLYSFPNDVNNPDYTAAFKTGTCYITIDVSGRSDLWTYLRGVNNYEGPIYKIASFNIEKGDISKCTADPIPDVTFDTSYFAMSSGMEPAVKLYVHGNKVDLTKYKVTYEDNTHGGVATAICSPEEGSPFTGTKKIKFNILPCNVDGKIRIDDIRACTYTGSAIEPSFFVFVDGWARGTDDFTRI